MTVQDKVESFLAGRRFAVVGASRDRAKYGNKVLRAIARNRASRVQIGLLMFIFFIRDARVVGLTPSNSAEPPCPDTFHSVCFRAAKMLSRSMRCSSS